MARGGRQAADEAVLMALACGATVEAAARQGNVSTATVYRRLTDPAFQRRLQRLRSDLVQRAAGMLTAAALEAVKTLLELQAKATPPGIRLGAARSVLELGLKLREHGELAERIAALEAQLAAVPAA